jgi:D-proline reductase (dithiol) PrdB
VGLLARSIEQLGVPTLTTTNVRDVTEKVKPPRAAFIDYPMGSCLGPPGDVPLQRHTLRAVLESLGRFTQPGQIVDLTLRWPVPGWEQEVERAFREEAHVLIAQRQRNQFDAQGNFIAGTAADEAAGYCAGCAV